MLTIAIREQRNIQFYMYAILKLLHLVLVINTKP